MYCQVVTSHHNAISLLVITQTTTNIKHEDCVGAFAAIICRTNRFYMAPRFIYIINCISCTYLGN